MKPTISMDQALQLLDLSRDILAGRRPDPGDVARALVGLALDLAPVEELAPFLTEAAETRARLVADSLERTKFGGAP